ncbi:MAG: co-chaperone DjlA [Victivallales bacterium]|nr:co-chaperone DjlA [Victivallales bacterium]
MGLWGKIICGGIGATLGGPIGALIGAGVGHFLFDSGNTSGMQRSFSTTEQTQAAYFACFFACLGKLIKADGIVTEQEVECLRQMLREEIQLDPESRKVAFEFVRRAKNDNTPASDYINQLAKIINYDIEMGKTFIFAFHKLAMADNVLHPAEKELLYYAEKAFRLRPGTVDNMIGRMRGNSKADLKTSYEVLGCSPDMNMTEIKKAYRKKCQEFHPDKIVNKGLPDEFVKFSNEQMVKIHNAYKTISKYRGTKT